MSGPGRETPIVAEAMRALFIAAPGANYWRANSGGNKSGHRCNSINLPDIVGWQRNGMALACEVKAHDGQLSLEQYNFLLDVHDRGGRAMVYAPTEENGPGRFWSFNQIPNRFLPTEKKRNDAL